MSIADEARARDIKSGVVKPKFYVCRSCNEITESVDFIDKCPSCGWEGEHTETSTYENAQKVVMVNVERQAGVKTMLSDMESGKITIAAREEPDDGRKTQRKYLGSLLKQRFDHIASWTRLAPTLQVLIAALPEPEEPESKVRFIAGIAGIRQYLLEQGINEKDLEFLNDEMERHRHTSQITLYEQKEDYVDDDTLKRFCHLSYTREGITGIPQPYTYGQLRRITNSVYRETGNIKFFIGQEETLSGKLSGKIYEHPQEIPIARLVMPKKDEGISRIALFGDAIDKKTENVVRDITAPFYVYRFVDRSLKEYMLLSVDDYPVGDYSVTGTVTTVQDNKQLTDSAKLTTKLPFLFAHTLTGRIIKYSKPSEFAAAVRDKHITPTDFFEFPFSFEVKNPYRKTEAEPETATVLPKHPRWFKWLVWAWLCHGEQGVGTKYPLHIMITASKGSGKTTLQNSLHRKSLEAMQPFSGTGSSLKFLVPSFKHDPPKPGYLVDSNRFAFLDEFLRTVTSIQDPSIRSESLAKLNDLLCHEAREFGSGNGTLNNVRMTARALFTNNAPRGIHSMTEFLEANDESFCSRLLILYQHENGAQMQMVRECREKDLKPYTAHLEVEDFVGFLDYLWTAESIFDADEVEKIYNTPIPLLSELQRNHYEARHKHHLDCLMDGVIKARCLQYGQASFCATPEDYAVVSEIWSNIIKGWIDGEGVRRLPLHQRVHYLPEASQWLFKQLVAENRSLSRTEVEALGEKGLDKAEFVTAYTILRSNGLVDDSEGFIVPYYLVKGYVREAEVLVERHKWSDDE